MARVTFTENQQIVVVSRTGGKLLTLRACKLELSEKMKTVTLRRNISLLVSSGLLEPQTAPWGMWKEASWFCLKLETMAFTT